MTSSQKSAQKRPFTRQLLWRYALTGGALGLYFGYFFKPLRDPNVILVVTLAALIALVMLALAWIRGEYRAPLPALQYAGTTFAKFALVLAVLEARHIVYDLGGRPLVLIFTAIMGALAGLWYGRSGIL